MAHETAHPPSPVRGDGPALLRAIEARLPGLRLRHRPGRPRGVPTRRDGLSARGPPAGSRPPGRDGTGRGARAPVRRARRADRPPRCGDRALGRRRGDRGCAHDRVHAHEPRARDRRGEPDGHDPARHRQRGPQGCCRGPRPVLRAGSGQLRAVHDRRQPRHQRRRPVLRQVRRDARCRPRPRGRHGRRDRPAPGRQERQGRRRLRAHPAARRLAGDAGPDDRGNAPAPACTAAPRDAASPSSPRSTRRAGPWRA